MNALTEFLFPAPARRSVGSIFTWWEKRRLAYNVAVGATGLFTLGYVTVAEWILPGGSGLQLPPLILPVAYGVLANICYTLGPMVEIAIDKLFRGEVLPTGPALYRMGLTFSLGLTFLPVLVITITGVIRVLLALF